MSASLGYRDVWSRAWPIILANSAVPLLGLTDTAVIGNFGTLPQLGAIALGALIFSFVYWGFGFLRMGTTGFTAQAAGAGDEIEVRAALGRALLIAAVLGLALIALQWPIANIALRMLSSSDEVESLAAGYFGIRIWGAPAVLGTYALMGSLIGLGRSRELLQAQLLLNGMNIVLDVLFAGVLGWGARGIALGTVVAECTTLLYAGVLVHGILRGRRTDTAPFWPWQRLRDPERLRHTLGANSDILIRTLALLFSFAWFVNQSAAFG
ncbi:MAG: MATE family efflux transporter, partial [Pseudomonadales bacterium]